jgi:hypothetical protein
MSAKTVYKEFRKDGWPFCPVCEEDELYSVVMLAYDGKGEQPTLEECLANEMRCYRCNWSSEGQVKKIPPARIFPNCFRCNQPFALIEGGRQFVYCPPCRIIIRREAEGRRVKDEVERMEWPDTIG